MAIRRPVMQCTNCAKYVNIIFLVMQTSYVCFDPSTLFLLFPDQCVCGRERPRQLTSVQRKNDQHSRRRRSIDSVTSRTEEFFMEYNDKDEEDGGFSDEIVGDVTSKPTTTSSKSTTTNHNQAQTNHTQIRFGGFEHVFESRIIGGSRARPVSSIFDFLHLQNITF